MILRKTVLCLGLSQLISWGISYYLIGGFGEPIAADFEQSAKRESFAVFAKLTIS
jgi:hypothetical protein